MSDVELVVQLVKLQDSGGWSFFLFGKRYSFA
jgi:hypothetical protein